MLEFVFCPQLACCHDPTEESDEDDFVHNLKKKKMKKTKNCSTKFWFYFDCPNIL
jgi:hypothetical protein